MTMEMSIGAILGDDEANYDLVKSVVMYLSIKQKTFTANDLVTIMGGTFTVHSLQNLLYALEAKGVVKEEGQHRQKQYILVNKEKLNLVLQQAYLTKIAHEEIYQKINKNHVISVATIPPYLKNKHPELVALFGDLYGEIHRLITSAQKTILLVTPFFEQQGMNMLTHALIFAAKRGVLIQVISRKLAENTALLNQLKNSFKAAGIRDKLCIYNYMDCNQSEVYTFHAKVLVTDREIAYVGSANFTQYAFERNIEIGFVLKGEHVNSINLLLEKMLNSEACTPMFDD